MMYSQKHVEKLGSILGIWAHPDDESWSSAGLMKMACLNGQKVGIVTATKGDAGETADSERWPQKELASIRENELKECLCNIGDIEQFWLEYDDGEMVKADSKSAVDELVRILNVFKPDTVITFEPNGITGHDDHKTISLWTSQAVRKVDMKIRVLHSMESQEKYDEVGKDLDNEFNIFFNVDKPQLVRESDADVVLKLPDEILECKLCCLKAHASQTSHLFSSSKGREALRVMASTECFVVESE